MRIKISFLSLCALGLLTGCSSEEARWEPLPPDRMPLEAENTPVEANGQTAYSQSQPAKVIEVSSAATSDYFPVRRCINMGNALEAEEEGAWGYKIEAGHFTVIKQAGFDTVRIPIRWDAHTSNQPPYKIDPAFMARIDAVVSQAQSAGLGVIIDIHHYEKLMENVSKETPRFIAIWEQIASYYQNAPKNVYFEVINEPIAPMKMHEANALYEKIVPIIRRTNPTRPLIMGGDNWNSIDSLDKVIWPNDPYLVATFHDYGPYEFTHQGASWLEGAPPTGRTWGRRSDLKELKSTYDLARDFKQKTGLPVLVGEFGVINTAPESERPKWLKVRRQTIEGEGMSWCVWDFAGAFKTYDVSQQTWLPGMLDALTRD